VQPRASCRKKAEYAPTVVAGIEHRNRTIGPLRAKRKSRQVEVERRVSYTPGPGLR
jgi:hypothetical protein